MSSVRLARVAALGSAILVALLVAPSSARAHGGGPFRAPGDVPAGAPPTDAPAPLPAPGHVIARLDDPAPAPGPAAPAPAGAPVPPPPPPPPDSAPGAPPSPIAPLPPLEPVPPNPGSPVGGARILPPPPPPPVMAIPDQPVVGPLLRAPGAASGPAPTARTRPPEPPPPDPEISGDVDHRDRKIPLGPSVPPPDPFDARAIAYRHDREVSGDGRIAEIRHIPQWVDVVDRRQLEEARPFSIADVVRREPNVMFADGASPFLAIPVIRGLSGERVKIETDGVWPSSQALGVAGGTLSLWDPESTERVEVYHGPGASLRGAEATGGVINVVPKRPHRHECLEAWGRLASGYASGDQRFRERAELEVGQGRIAALAGLTYEDHGDIDTAHGTLDPSTFNTWAGDLALDYFLDNQSTVGFTGQHVRVADIRSPIRGTGALAQPKYERTFLGMTLTSFGIGPVFHGTRLSFAFDDFLQNNDAQLLAPGVNGIQSADKVRRLDLRLQGSLYIWPCHNTWAELALAYAHTERTEAILPHVPARIAPPIEVNPQAVPGGPARGSVTYEVEEWILKGLIEDEWYEGCWDYHVGARADWHHLSDTRTGETRDQVLFGAAGGVVHQLSKCWSTYANASYGRRYPSLEELFAVSVLDGRIVYPDPNLSPETSFAAEAGIRGTVFNKYTWSADVFGHYLVDFIGRRPIGADDVWSNEGDVFLYGAESVASFRPDPCKCEGLEFFGSAGVTFSDRHALVDPMPLSGRLGTRWSNCVGCPDSCGFRRWFVEGALRGGLDQGFHPTDSDNAYLTADLLGGVGFSQGGRRAVQVTGGVTNLFDTWYREPFARLPATGRSLFLSVQWDF